MSDPNAVGREGPLDPVPGRDAVPGSQGTGPLRPTRGDRPEGSRRRGGRRAERAMVPDAHFTSYYGRPVVKPSPWEADIPAYLFLGGLAAGSSLLAAGADLTGRDSMRRGGRVTALGAIGLSFAALVHDLGRPQRFLNMLRVAKPTSPMSVGTWLLTAYGPLAGLAAVAEASPLVPGLPGRLLGTLGRPAGLGAAAVAPAVAAYTAVLLSNTATPSWHDARRELPFVFVGSAAAASGGAAMLVTPVGECGPARRLACAGAVLELIAEARMEKVMGLTAEPLHTGTPGRLMRAGRLLTVGGGLLALASTRRLLGLGGLALMAGSACTRFGIFQAGQASALDPKYTVIPQRERLDRDGPTQG